MYSRSAFSAADVGYGTIVTWPGSFDRPSIVSFSQSSLPRTALGRAVGIEGLAVHGAVYLGSVTIPVYDVFQIRVLPVKNGKTVIRHVVVAHMIGYSITIGRNDIVVCLPGSETGAQEGQDGDNRGGKLLHAV